MLLPIDDANTTPNAVNMANIPIVFLVTHAVNSIDIFYKKIQLELTEYLRHYVRLVSKVDSSTFSRVDNINAFDNGTAVFLNILTVVKIMDNEYYSMKRK